VLCCQNGHAGQSATFCGHTRDLVKFYEQKLIPQNKYRYPTFQLVEFNQEILPFHKYFLISILTHCETFFQTGNVSFLVSISLLQLLLHQHQQSICDVRLCLAASAPHALARETEAAAVCCCYAARRRQSVSRQSSIRIHRNSYSCAYHTVDLIKYYSLFIITILLIVHSPPNVNPLKWELTNQSNIGNVNYTKEEFIQQLTKIVIIKFIRNHSCRQFTYLLIFINENTTALFIQ